MEQTNKQENFKLFTVVARVDAPRKGMAADYLAKLLNAGSTPDAIVSYDLLDAIETLRRYVQDEHKGELADALATIGGLRRVRAILGLKDHSALDPALYVQDEYRNTAPKDVKVCGLRMGENQLLVNGEEGRLYIARLAEDAHGEGSRGMLQLHDGTHFRGGVQLWQNRKGKRVYRVGYASSENGNWKHTTRPSQASAEKILVRLATSGRVISKQKG